MSHPFLSICAPVFNEEENIEAQVLIWLSLFEKQGINGEIVVANDGSTDRTGAILESLATSHENLKVISLSQNHGYGTALSIAITHSTGQFVMTIDSDGQFDAADFGVLHSAMVASDAGLVTGYRTGKKDTPFRVAADRMLNLIVRLMFRLNLRDTNCALKLGRGDLLRSIELESTGFPMPTELMIKAIFKGAKVVEAPVTHRERSDGVSKVHPIKTSFLFLVFLLYLRMKLSLIKYGIIEPGKKIGG